MKGKGFIHQGSTLGFADLSVSGGFIPRVSVCIGFRVEVFRFCEGWDGDRKGFLLKIRAYARSHRGNVIFECVSESAQTLHPKPK